MKKRIRLQTFYIFIDDVLIRLIRYIAEIYLRKGKVASYLDHYHLVAELAGRNCPVAGQIPTFSPQPGNGRR